MTSQPETLTEAQAAYEAAKHALDTSSARNKVTPAKYAVEAAERLIALQAARIQELETEATQLKAEVRRSGLMPEFYESCQQLLAKLEGEDAAIFDALLMAHGVSASESRRLYANVAELMGIEEHMVAPSGIALYEQLMESWLPVHDREVSTARIASLEAEVEAAVDKNEQLERDKERMEYRMPDAEMIVVNAHAWCDKMGAARQYGNGSKIPLWIRLLIVEVGFEQATQAEHAAAQAPADAESGVTA